MLVFPQDVEKLFLYCDREMFVLNLADYIEKHKISVSSDYEHASFAINSYGLSYVDFGHNNQYSMKMFGSLLRKTPEELRKDSKRLVKLLHLDAQKLTQDIIANGNTTMNNTHDLFKRDRRGPKQHTGHKQSKI